MGLYRRSGASLRLKRTASWWTSVGVAATLLAGVMVMFAYENFQVYFFGDETSRDSIEPRQLANALIPNDPFIDTPIETATNKGWVVIHIIVIAYMLLGLNTVCDAYFTGALDSMVNKWHIKPDVAGATFMAAGGSAPELFTSLIGACVSESDVGFSTIVGSAVFNVLFVIGLCGLLAKAPIKLTWWPLFRDCTYYIFGLILLAVFAKTGGEIELWEAIVLFLVYLGYCVMMYFNPQLEAMVLQTGDAAQDRDKVIKMDQVAPVPDTGSTAEVQEETPRFCAGQPKFNRSLSNLDKVNEKNGNSGDQKKGDSVMSVDQGGAAQSAQDAEKEEEEDDIEALLLKPDSVMAQVIWYLSLPVYLPLYYLIPKPTERCFLASFCVSLLFIAGLSFFLVYCVEVLGACLGIHIVIMGFTLLAAGTSIPDAVSSVAVARAGEGDMAVSSSIGSNIFDILVGLPIPWIIKIAFVEMAGKGNSDATIKIFSDYIVMYVIILMFMVFCVIISIHMLGWVLNKVLGVGMAFLYCIFLATVLTVEFTEPEALKF